MVEKTMQNKVSADRIPRERHAIVMRHRKSSAALLLAAAILGAVCAAPLPARAAGALPHLIQTVTDRDIYEGMLALGYLETAALETPDCVRAYANIKDCVVQIRMGNAHGSGIIWELSDEYVIIVTNRHVLRYWTAEQGYVHFPQGFDTDAQLVGVSAQYDVGFVAVDRRLFTYEELQELRYARIDTEAFEALQPGDEMFLADPGSAQHDAQYYQGSVEDKDRYIEDFDAHMLYGHCFARAGMSGGGTFDGRGYLIGMTTGGTDQNETASVPLPDMIEAYREVVAGTAFAGRASAAE